MGQDRTGYIGWERTGQVKTAEDRMGFRIIEDRIGQDSVGQDRTR